ncbi:MAG: six-hairpin glycosidase [Mediterranea massiliensis]|nr:six-hairpin glycosidase [Mediterranea massiliensis]
MRKIAILIVVLVALIGTTSAQAVDWLDKLPEGHPRFLTTSKGRDEVKRMVAEESWASEVFYKLQQRTDNYVNKGGDWLSSRLQMFWNTHATEVYIKGEYYDHAGGEKAPAPTVMLSGARSHVTNYQRPRLEEITPWQEDARGLWLRNKALEGQPYEWASISKTGNIIQSINNEIAGIARDAAFLWWITGEEKYAKSALSVFDTYMTGIYYRNVPQDLNHGHQQTLVGMSSFEVIHEDILNALVPLYDFLYPYLLKHLPEKMPLYAAAFKKWADNIIANGVPHNNWNLMQARFVMNIGLILENNATYEDGRGRQYYIDYVLNQSTIRQWSLKQLADYGYDARTGIWAECPGYSQVVLNDYTDLVTIFHRNFGKDLLQDIPVIARAAKNNFQYLFPDRMYIGFGDTHPGTLNPAIYRRLIANAQQYNKPEEEALFTSLLKLLQPEKNHPTQLKEMPVAVTSFFSEKPLQINPAIPAADINDFVTPTFYAPNASWLVQRNGMHPRHSLMIALNASEGNHMHANGISMELYGKGYRLAPDAGIGFYSYSGQDYLEYYSQFPSHNTVCVDGISSYPVMKSNHSFKLLNLYPASEADVAYPTISYSNLYFREPESQADQTRLMSIVTTSATTGYYVDIFRSRKVEGNDKMHDYFYHNMGRQMTLTATDNTDLNLQPTEELSFAGAHLYAYSYIYNKKSALTDRDVKATFTIPMPDKDDISMTMWMKGEPQRKVFAALSPPTEGLSRLQGMPYNMKEEPTLTFVARQQGEAWKRPFVAIYEPSSLQEPATIHKVSFPEVEADADGSHVAIKVEHINNRRDYIISSDNPAHRVQCADMTLSATYGVWVQTSQGTEQVFMGGGTRLQIPDLEISALEVSDVMLQKKNGDWYYTTSAPCLLKIQGQEYQLLPGTTSRVIVKE